MKPSIFVPKLLVSAFCAAAVVALNPAMSGAQTAPAAPKTAVVEGADNFYKSDKVTMQKVSFKNQYAMKVVGNLFVPKTLVRGRWANHRVTL